MRNRLQGQVALGLFVAGLLAAAPLRADRPDWAGNGKRDNGAHEWRDERPRGDDRRADRRYDDRDRSRGYFSDRQRMVIRDYYADRYRAGNCPPGLAKKHNGCMPPGQARKWAIGRPLPPDVAYYDLPARVVVSLGVPPAGHKYVRIAGDILLIAVGTGMVVDAIQDLGR